MKKISFKLRFTGEAIEHTNIPVSINASDRKLYLYPDTGTIVYDLDGITDLETEEDDERNTWNYKDHDSLEYQSKPQ